MHLGACLKWYIYWNIFPSKLYVIGIWRNIVKALIKTIFITAITLVLAGCPDKDKSSGGTATAPPSEPEITSGACQYDYYSGYRYEDGTACSYDEWHDPNACYNYTYNSYYGKYYDQEGYVVDCNQQYINGQNVFPYQNYSYSGSGWQVNQQCPWGSYPSPIGGGNFTVCVSNQVNPGIDLGWWWWINL